MQIDPITRLTCNCATFVFFHSIPQNVAVFALAKDENNVLTSKFVLRATPTFFGSKQFQSAISPNNFSAQEAGIFSIAELNFFWNCLLMTNHSDTSLVLLQKTISFEFFGYFWKPLN